MSTPRDRPPAGEGDTLVLDDPPAARRGRRWPPWDPDRDIAVGLLALLVVLALVAGGIWLATREDEQTVPDVVGLELPEARERLAEAELRDRVEEAPADQPRGEVVAQSPGAGEPAPDDGVVVLTVSEGPRTLTLPRVVGLTVDEATERLADLGIETETRDVASNQPRDTVVRQQPPAGEDFDRESGPVVLFVAARDAPETVEVPGLVGMAAAEARAALEDLGLAHTQRPEASEQPEGTVIRQSPGAGSEVQEGATVTLTVSTGPAAVEVPDVVGLSESDARAELRDAGFRVEVDERQTDDAAEDGIVQRQSPRAGAERARDAVVTIVVARLA